MTWDRTMEALNALTGNWAFEIRLYVKDGLTGQVFNNLSQAPLKLYDDLVSSGEASFYLRNYVTMSEWTGWHVIRLEVTDGNASLYLDGIFQATKSTGTTITPVTRDSATDADIGIDYIKLENLTSGAVLWHSEYQDTHAIYKARDFSTSYQWPAVGTALRTIPWTDDYHFHFVFTVPDSLSNGSYWLMYQSNGRIVFSLDKDARGCRFAFGSFAFADNLTVYTPFQPSLAGTHDVTLTVSGTMLSLALDGTVYEQTGERTASSEYDRAVTTSAPVTIHEITLTDDTSSTEVWHAAYIDLNAKYPALPWPAQSCTLRCRAILRLTRWRGWNSAPSRRPSERMASRSKSPSTVPPKRPATFLRRPFLRLHVGRDQHPVPDKRRQLRLHRGGGRRGPIR